MAHFAELDENNIVKRVIVVDNRDTSDANGVEKEYIGVAFCERIFGGRWIQTSYNANKRKNYAGIGYTYDEQRDAFIPIKLFSSWMLDEATCRWQPPVPMPNDGKIYQWNEETTSWNEITVTPE
jgi:hypothetical protein